MSTPQPSQPSDSSTPSDNTRPGSDEPITPDAIFESSESSSTPGASASGRDNRSGGSSASPFDGVPLIDNLRSRLAALSGRTWPMLALASAASLILGLLVLAAPGLTATVITIVFGLLAVVIGASIIALGFRSQSPRQLRGPAIIVSLLFILPGLLAITIPQRMAAVAVILLAVVLILSAVATGLAGAWIPAIIVFIIGFVLILAPWIGIVTLGWLFGLVLVAGGIALGAAAWSLYRTSTSST